MDPFASNWPMGEETAAPPAPAEAEPTPVAPPSPLITPAPEPAMSSSFSAGMALVLVAAGAAAGYMAGGGYGAGAGAIFVGAARNGLRAKRQWATDPTVAAKTATLSLVGVAIGGYLAYRAYQAERGVTELE